MTRTQGASSGSERGSRKAALQGGLLLLLPAAACALAGTPPPVSKAAAALSPTPTRSAGADPGPVIVGAIRWDAYFATPGTEAFDDPNFGVVSRATTGDMSPKKWHYRVPFFGKEVNDTAIEANGNTPEVMGQELQYAADHGIKFWSFCNYPIGCKDQHPPASACVGIQCCADNVGLSYAWNLYLNHPDRHKVKFTLLLQPGYWFHGQESGSNETWAQELQRYTTYFKMPNYQTVDIGEKGRPLVFSFGRGLNLTHLADFIAATKAAIGVSPYVVSMNGQQAPGIDAVSRYGGGSGALNGSDYETHLAQKEVADWTARAKAGTKQVPTVSAGSDDRPRSEYPMPWGPKYWGKSYVKDPTMPQLTSHVEDGLKFVAANRKSAETNMMILSAWNEYDEGHYIAPVLQKYGGAEKLQAIKKAIDGAEARRKAYWASVLGEE